MFVRNLYIKMIFFFLKKKCVPLTLPIAIVLIVRKIQHAMLD